MLLTPEAYKLTRKPSNAMTRTVPSIPEMMDVRALQQRVQAYNAAKKERETMYSLLDPVLNQAARYRIKKDAWYKDIPILNELLVTADGYWHIVKGLFQIQDPIKAVLNTMRFLGDTLDSVAMLVKAPLTAWAKGSNVGDEYVKAFGLGDSGRYASNFSEINKYVDFIPDGWLMDLIGEVVIDPMNWVNFGTSALSKGILSKGAKGGKAAIGELFQTTIQKYGDDIAGAVGELTQKLGTSDEVIRAVYEYAFKAGADDVPTILKSKQIGGFVQRLNRAAFSNDQKEFTDIMITLTKNEASSYHSMSKIVDAYQSTKMFTTRHKVVKMLFMIDNFENNTIKLMRAFTPINAVRRGVKIAGKFINRVSDLQLDSVLKVMDDMQDLTPSNYSKLTVEELQSNYITIKTRLEDAIAKVSTVKTGTPEAQALYDEIDSLTRAIRTASDQIHYKNYYEFTEGMVKPKIKTIRDEIKSLHKKLEEVTNADERELIKADIANHEEAIAELEDSLISGTDLKIAIEGLQEYDLAKHKLEETDVPDDLLKLDEYRGAASGVRSLRDSYKKGDDIETLVNNIEAKLPPSYRGRINKDMDIDVLGHEINSILKEIDATTHRLSDAQLVIDYASKSDLHAKYITSLLRKNINAMNYIKHVSTKVYAQYADNLKASEQSLLEVSEKIKKGINYHAALRKDYVEQERLRLVETLKKKYGNVKGQIVDQVEYDNEYTTSLAAIKKKAAKHIREGEANLNKIDAKGQLERLAKYIHDNEIDVSGILDDTYNEAIEAYSKAFENLYTYERVIRFKKMDAIISHNDITLYRTLRKQYADMTDLSFDLKTLLDESFKTLQESSDFSYKKLQTILALEEDEVLYQVQIAKAKSHTAKAHYTTKLEEVRTALAKQRETEPKDNRAYKVTKEIIKLLQHTGSNPGGKEAFVRSGRLMKTFENLASITEVSYDGRLKDYESTNKVLQSIDAQIKDLDTRKGSSVANLSRAKQKARPDWNPQAYNRLLKKYNLISTQSNIITSSGDWPTVVSEYYEKVSKTVQDNIQKADAERAELVKQIKANPRLVKAKQRLREIDADLETFNKELDTIQKEYNDDLDQLTYNHNVKLGRSAEALTVVRTGSKNIVVATAGAKEELLKQRNALINNNPTFALRQRVEKYLALKGVTLEDLATMYTDYHTALTELKVKKAFNIVNVKKLREDHRLIFELLERTDNVGLDGKKIIVDGVEQEGLFAMVERNLNLDQTDMFNTGDKGEFYLHYLNTLMSNSPNAAFAYEASTVNYLFNFFKRHKYNEIKKGVATHLLSDKELLMRDTWNDLRVLQDGFKKNIVEGEPHFLSSREGLIQNTITRILENQGIQMQIVIDEIMQYGYSKNLLNRDANAVGEYLIKNIGAILQSNGFDKAYTADNIIAFTHQLLANMRNSTYKMYTDFSEYTNYYLKRAKSLTIEQKLNIANKLGDETVFDYNFKTHRRNVAAWLDLTDREWKALNEDERRVVHTIREHLAKNPNISRDEYVKRLQRIVSSNEGLFLQSKSDIFRQLKRYADDPLNVKGIIDDLEQRASKLLEEGDSFDNHLINSILYRSEMGAWFKLFENASLINMFDYMQTGKHMRTPEIMKEIMDALLSIGQRPGTTELMIPESTRLMMESFVRTTYKNVLDEDTFLRIVSNDTQLINLYVSRKLVQMMDEINVATLRYDDLIRLKRLPELTIDKVADSAISKVLGTDMFERVFNKGFLAGFKDRERVKVLQRLQGTDIPGSKIDLLNSEYVFFDYETQKNLNAPEGSEEAFQLNLRKYKRKADGSGFEEVSVNTYFIRMPGQKQLTKYTEQFTKISNETYSQSKQYDVANHELYSRMLEDGYNITDNTILVAHNANYDTAFLKQVGIQTNPYVMDTLPLYQAMFTKELAERPSFRFKQESLAETFLNPDRVDMLRAKVRSVNGFETADYHNAEFDTGISAMLLFEDSTRFTDLINKLPNKSPAELDDYINSHYLDEHLNDLRGVFEGRFTNNGTVFRFKGGSYHPGDVPKGFVLPPHLKDLGNMSPKKQKQLIEYYKQMGYKAPDSTEVILTKRLESITLAEIRAGLSKEMRNTADYGVEEQYLAGLEDVELIMNEINKITKGSPEQLTRVINLSFELQDKVEDMRAAFKAAAQMTGVPTPFKDIHSMVIEELEQAAIEYQQVISKASKQYEALLTTIYGDSLGYIRTAPALNNMVIVHAYQGNYELKAIRNILHGVNTGDAEFDEGIVLAWQSAVRKRIYQTSKKDTHLLRNMQFDDVLKEYIELFPDDDISRLITTLDDLEDSANLQEHITEILLSGYDINDPQSALAFSQFYDFMSHMDGEFKKLSNGYALKMQVAGADVAKLQEDMKEELFIRYLENIVGTKAGRVLSPIKTIETVLGRKSGDAIKVYMDHMFAQLERNINNPDRIKSLIYNPDTDASNELYTVFKQYVQDVVARNEQITRKAAIGYTTNDTINDGYSLIESTKFKKFRDLLTTGVENMRAPLRAIRNERKKGEMFPIHIGRVNEHLQSLKNTFAENLKNGIPNPESMAQTNSLLSELKGFWHLSSLGSADVVQYTQATREARLVTKSVNSLLEGVTNNLEKIIAYSDSDASRKTFYNAIKELIGESERFIPDSIKRTRRRVIDVDLFDGWMQRYSHISYFQNLKAKLDLFEKTIQHPYNTIIQLKNNVEGDAVDPKAIQELMERIKSIMFRDIMDRQPKEFREAITDLLNNKVTYDEILRSGKEDAYRFSRYFGSSYADIRNRFENPEEFFNYVKGAEKRGTFMSVLVKSPDSASGWAVRKHHVKNIEELTFFDRMINNPNDDIFMPVGFLDEHDFQKLQKVTKQAFKFGKDSFMGKLKSLVLMPMKSMMLLNSAFVLGNVVDINTKNLISQEGGIFDADSVMGDIITATRWEKTYQNYYDMAKEVLDFGNYKSSYEHAWVDAYRRLLEFKGELTPEIERDLQITSFVSQFRKTPAANSEVVDMLERLNAGVIGKGKDSSEIQRVINSVFYNGTPFKQNLEFNGYLELIGRLSLHINDIKKGYTVEESLLKILKTHFNYGNKTKAELHAEFVIPFVSYPLRSFMFWSEALFAKGANTRFLMDVFRTSWGTENLEDNDYARYQASRGNLPVGNYVIQTNVTFADALGLVGQQPEAFGIPQQAIRKLNPLLKNNIAALTPDLSSEERLLRTPGVSQIRNVYNAATAPKKTLDVVLPGVADTYYQGQKNIMRSSYAQRRADEQKTYSYSKGKVMFRGPNSIKTMSQLRWKWTNIQSSFRR